MGRRPPRREVVGARFDGARELDRLLREIDVPVPVFCEEHGLDRFHVQRLLGGHVKRSPPVDIVLSIEKASDGRITPMMWLESTLRDDEPDDVPRGSDSSSGLNDDESGPTLPSADEEPSVPHNNTRKAAS